MIVSDPGGLFFHDKFEEFFRPFWILSRTHSIRRSPFRDIYLLTKSRGGDVFVPLRCSLFLADCFAFESLLWPERRLPQGQAFTKAVARTRLEALIAALHLAGHHGRVNVSPSGVSLFAGAWNSTIRVAARPYVIAG